MNWDIDVNRVEVYNSIPITKTSSICGVSVAAFQSLKYCLMKVKIDPTFNDVLRALINISLVSANLHQ
jgi:hypothetical protein